MKSFIIFIKKKIKISFEKYDYSSEEISRYK
jgi:hypothetical protein